MLLRILAFELRYQVRQPLFWIACALFFLLTFAAITTDVVSVGGAIGSVHRNAPFVILQMLGVMTAVGTLLTTAFVSNSVHRDFESQTDALFFSLPLKKRDYLLGRFAGALLVALLVFGAVILAIVVGAWMPWIDPARVGPFRLRPYLEGLLVFVLPNLFLTGAIFFCIATLTRSLLHTYAGVVIFFVGFAIAGVLLDDLDNRSIGALVDPYGVGAFELLTRYWTVSEKNAGSLSLTGVLLLNRILWVGLAVLILAFTCVRFRLTMTETGKARRRRLMMMAADAAPPSGAAAAVRSTATSPPALPRFGPATA